MVDMDLVSILSALLAGGMMGGHHAVLAAALGMLGLPLESMKEFAREQPTNSRAWDMLGLSSATGEAWEEMRRLAIRHWWHKRGTRNGNKKATVMTGTRWVLP